MKRIVTVISCLVLFGTFSSCSKKSGSPGMPSPLRDNFKVVVNNGYGSGEYKVGDTVHTFSVNYTDKQFFENWSGKDTTLLDGRREWHTWFVMPDKDVTFTGNIKNSIGFSLKFEKIMGKERLKPVYYYVPPIDKGIVYLLHGTNGTAAHLVGSYEWQLLIRDLVNDGFGVVVTEAEEATTGVDANGDGKLRWLVFPLDSTKNIDYANIKAITDTLYYRGIADPSKPRFSIGMSDGGFFSAGLASLFHFKAGVQYCSQGSRPIMNATSIPTQFCMAKFDNNPSIGAQGNVTALTYSKALNARGVCSRYLINERSSLYPERFARRGDIPVDLSKAIFNELKSKGYLDNKNYFKGYSNAFITAYKANPTSFPVINSLTPSQKQFMLAQINLSVTDHHIYSDYDKATLRFLNSRCK